MYYIQNAMAVVLFVVGADEIRPFLHSYIFSVSTIFSELFIVDGVWVMGFSVMISAAVFSAVGCCPSNAGFLPSCWVMSLVGVTMFSSAISFDACCECSVCSSFMSLGSADGLSSPSEFESESTGSGLTGADCLLFVCFSIRSLARRCFVLMNSLICMSFSGGR